jgi:hypothetical protein
MKFHKHSKRSITILKNKLNNFKNNKEFIN